MLGVGSPSAACMYDGRAWTPEDSWPASLIDCHSPTSEQTTQFSRFLSDTLEVLTSNMTSSDTMSMTSHMFTPDWGCETDSFTDASLYHLSCDQLSDFGVPQRRSILPSVSDNFSGNDSDYLSNSSTSPEPELENNNYSLYNMTPYKACDRQIPTDDDNESVMLDDIFLQDVDKYDRLGGQCSAPLSDQHCLLYNTQASYSNPSPYTCRSDTYRPLFSSSSDSYSSYSVSPPYNSHGVGQQAFVMPNLPNLPDLDMTGSPGRLYPYGSSGDESDSESEGEPRTRKGKRGSKSVLLWKFLLECLADPTYAPQILKWENKEMGIFKFMDTGAVAKLWGKQKRKQDMNFEKLSRGIRHYYKAGMMNRVEGKRLVYKFNWKKVPKEYRRRQ